MLVSLILKDAVKRIKNDCCEVSKTPFCNNSTIVACVCQRYDERCCNEKWTKVCTDAVSLCSNRDCFGEKLPPHENHDCLVSHSAKNLTIKLNQQKADHFSCLDVNVSMHGAWFHLNSKQNNSVRIDTCHPETSVADASIFVFLSCDGKCLAHALPTSHCSAKTALLLDAGVTYYIFVGSSKHGTLRVSFDLQDATSLEVGGQSFVPIVVIGCIVFAVVVVLSIAVLYFQSKKSDSFSERP